MYENERKTVKSKYFCFSLELKKKHSESCHSISFFAGKLREGEGETLIKILVFMAARRRRESSKETKKKCFYHHRASRGCADGFVIAHANEIIRKLNELSKEVLMT